MSEKAAYRGRILVVEDEAYVRESLVAILRSRGFEPVAASSAAETDALLARAAVDAVLTDLKMPGTDGLDLVKRLLAATPDLPVIVLTGHGTVASAVACLRAGASDYILKPADPEALEVSLERALAQRLLRRELRYLRAAVVPGAEALVGESAAWKKVMAMVEVAAPTDSTVLLLGESGTGKELLARRLHALSQRSGGPFVRVNCAAVPLEMWESEFFGHRRGAFTGAAGDRDGRFQLAHRGTLLLDEVAAMPAAGQAKLLRVIQDGEFHRVGDEQATRVDVRVVAATNSDLEADVQRGQFRADLFYRLNVVRIQVPALRDRPEDVTLLAGHFAAEIAARLGRPTPDLGPETLARLRAYPWPGNARELRNVIERALILQPVGGIEHIDLPAASAGAGAEAAAAGRDLNLREAMSRLERELLVEALRRSRGVRKDAARLLGIDPRNLSYYLRKHDLDAQEPS